MEAYLPNILRQNAFHDPSDDDGPDELTDAEAEEYKKQFFPKDNQWVQFVPTFLA